MKQQTAAIKQKKQNRVVYQVLIILFVAFVCMIVVFQQNRMLNMHTHKLILTPQGCSYFTSLGLTTNQESSGCSIIARSNSGFLGSGREILLDDDRFISLSSAAILADADTDEALPNTPGQQRALHITWGAYAVLITLLIMLVYAGIKD